MIRASLACVSFVLLLACTERSTQNDPPRRSVAVTSVPSTKRPPMVSHADIEPARAAATPPSRLSPTARVHEIVGTVTRVRDNSHVEARATLNALEWFDTGTDGRVVFDFPEEGRVIVYPGSRFQLGDDRSMQLILATGAVEGTLVPIGNSPRSPLRIATLRSTTEITGSGDVFVQTSADGSSTTTTVLLGEISMHTGTREAGGRPVATRVHAGQTYSVSRASGVALADGQVGRGLGEIGEAPAHSDVATLVRARARVARICDTSPAVRAAAEELARLLQTSLAAAETTISEQRSLDLQHRELSRTNSTGAIGLLSAVALKAQLVARNRNHLLTLWESAESLQGCSTEIWQSTFEPLKARAQAIVGSE